MSNSNLAAYRLVAHSETHSLLHPYVCVTLNALTVLHGHRYHLHLNLRHHQNRCILLNTNSSFPSPAPDVCVLPTSFLWS